MCTTTTASAGSSRSQASRSLRARDGHNPIADAEAVRIALETRVRLSRAAVPG